MSELGGHDGGDERSTTERFAVGERVAQASGITPRFAKFLLAIFSIGLVGISVFQSTDNYYAHRRQDRQGIIVKKLVDQTEADSERLRSDDEFFAAVRQLIILGPNADAAQRQAVIDELKREDAARSAATSTTTTLKPGKVQGGTMTPPTSKKPSTVPSSQPTTTTTRPLSPPSSTSVPPSSVPSPSVCIGSICVTVPQATILKAKISTGVDLWIFNLFRFVRDVVMR